MMTAHINKVYQIHLARFCSTIDSIRMDIPARINRGESANPAEGVDVWPDLKDMKNIDWRAKALAVAKKAVELLESESK